MSKDLIEKLELLVKSDHWKTLVRFAEWRKQEIESVLYSLKVDKYRANGSTVLIKQREEVDNILKIKDVVEMEYDEEKIKHEFKKGINDLITELEGGEVKKESVTSE